MENLFTQLKELVNLYFDEKMGNKLTDPSEYFDRPEIIEYIKPIIDSQSDELEMDIHEIHLFTSFLSDMFDFNHNRAMNILKQIKPPETQAEMQDNLSPEKRPESPREIQFDSIPVRQTGKTITQSQHNTQSRRITELPAMQSITTESQPDMQSRTLTEGQPAIQSPGLRGIPQEMNIDFDVAVPEDLEYTPTLDFETARLSVFDIFAADRDFPDEIATTPESRPDPVASPVLNFFERIKGTKDHVFIEKVIALEDPEALDYALCNFIRHWRVNLLLPDSPLSIIMTDEDPKDPPSNSQQLSAIQQVRDLTDQVHLSATSAQNLSEPMTSSTNAGTLNIDNMPSISSRQFYGSKLSSVQEKRRSLQNTIDINQLLSGCIDSPVSTMNVLDINSNIHQSDLPTVEEINHLITPPIAQPTNNLNTEIYVNYLEKLRPRNIRDGLYRGMQATIPPKKRQRRSGVIAEVNAELEEPETELALQLFGSNIENNSCLQIFEDIKSSKLFHSFKKSFLNSQPQLYQNYPKLDSQWQLHPSYTETFTSIRDLCKAFIMSPDGTINLNMIFPGRISELERTARKEKIKRLTDMEICEILNNDDDEMELYILKS